LFEDINRATEVETPTATPLPETPDGSLEPITAVLPDKVNKKECGPVFSQPTQLEPLTTGMPDKVNKKDCGPATTTPKPPAVVPQVAPVALPRPIATVRSLGIPFPKPEPAPQTAPTPTTAPQTAPAPTPPSQTAPTPATDGYDQLLEDINQATETEPTRLEQLAPPAAANPLTFATPKPFPTNTQQAPYRLQFGEPQQGPIPETVDPSGIYTRTRNQLRKTGRTLGARRTFRRRNIR
jgi:hypothetical protein